MSKLDELGGIEAARKLAVSTCDANEDYEERMVFSLIERIEELEREIASLNKMYDGTDVELTMMEGKLYQARELADYLISDFPNLKGAKAKAREVLEGTSAESK